MQIIKVIKENFGLKIYLAENDGKTVFVKDPIADEGYQMIAREYANQNFLWNLSQKSELGFKFLKPVLAEGKLIFPYLGDDYIWLGNIQANHFVTPIEQYLDKLLVFIKFFHESIDYESLPEVIKNDSQTRNKNSKNRFDQDGDYLLKNNLITKQEIFELEKRFTDKAEIKAYQHHDPMPWHMAKSKKTGDIYLIDSGWSGWSLWAYDISYFLSQIIAYGQDLKAAENFYQRVKEIYAAKKDFDQLLACALAYRGTRLLAELHKNNRVENLSKIKDIIINSKI